MYPQPIVLIFASLTFKTCRNKRRNRKPHKRKKYGWFKNDGMFVMENHLLVNQRALNIYPGENVGVNPDKSLFALRAGNSVGLRDRWTDRKTHFKKYKERIIKIKQ